MNIAANLSLRSLLLLGAFDLPVSRARDTILFGQGDEVVGLDIFTLQRQKEDLCGRSGRSHIYDAAKAHLGRREVGLFWEIEREAMQRAQEEEHSLLFCRDAFKCIIQINK